MEKEIKPVGDSSESNKKNVAVEALKEIIDPELAINIYDLGLVRNISIEDDGINILMTLTTPLCPFADIIMQDVETGLLLNVLDVHKFHHL